MFYLLRKESTPSGCIWVPVVVAVVVVMLVLKDGWIHNADIQTRPPEEPSRPELPFPAGLQGRDAVTFSGAPAIYTNGTHTPMQFLQFLMFFLGFFSEFSSFCPDITR